MEWLLFIFNGLKPGDYLFLIIDLFVVVFVIFFVVKTSESF